jgi:hypothetical protein
MNSILHFPYLAVKYYIFSNQLSQTLHFLWPIIGSGVYFHSLYNIKKIKIRKNKDYFISILFISIYITYNRQIYIYIYIKIK